MSTVCIVCALTGFSSSFWGSFRIQISIYIWNHRFMWIDPRSAGCTLNPIIGFLLATCLTYSFSKPKPCGRGDDAFRCRECPILFRGIYQLPVRSTHIFVMTSRPRLVWRAAWSRMLRCVVLKWRCCAILREDDHDRTHQASERHTVEYRKTAEEEEIDTRTRPDTSA